jgi:DNA polymerase-3 subunit delta'
VSGGGADREADPFAAVPEQAEAKRLLRAALGEGGAHAFLLHGPAGTGKRRAARAFAAAVLGDAARVAHGTHPDLYVLEPVGEMIRIDEIRRLRHDLHLRPYEAQHRVYVIHATHLLNDDAADALLKDLEEPPAYALILLLADELGQLPETIRSRCQLVPFRRLSGRAIRAYLDEHAPGLDEAQRVALARVAGGRLDRAERLLDPEAATRRAELLATARSVYADAEFDPAEAAATVLDAARRSGVVARDRAEAELEGLGLPAREADQRVRRAQRGAEREELLASLEELASWYRDLVVATAGAESALVHADHLPVLREDASPARGVDAERAAELVRGVWRSLEEFNLAPQLALEALFVQLRRAFANAVPA